MKATDPKKYSFTLGDISDLLDNKLSIFSSKVDSKFSALEEKLTKKIDQSATGIIAEMDKRFAQVDKRFDEVDKRFVEVDKRFERVDKRFDAMNKRFDDNDDTHQIILGAIDEVVDRKLEKHCREKHSFATA